MIPWTNFDNVSRNEIPEDIRVRLYEHWLEYVALGPSMTDVYFESPMLEVAHERQFVISQQGGDCAEFEGEHTRRIAECLKHLDHYFLSHAVEDSFTPGSPCRIDLQHCWQPPTSLATIPPLHLFNSEGPKVIPIDSDLAYGPPLSSATSSVAQRTTNSEIVPEVDVDDEEGISDGTAEQYKRSVLAQSRTSSALPICGARAPKVVRQRKRPGSKIAMDSTSIDRKRSRQWMVSEDEDDFAAATRQQSIARMMVSRLDILLNDPCGRALQIEQT